MGVDVFRLNFSYANHDEIAHAVPRIRTDFLPGGEPIALETGAIVEVSGNDPVTSPSAMHVTYPRIAEDVAWDLEMPEDLAGVVLAQYGMLSAEDRAILGRAAFIAPLGFPPRPLPA